MDEEDLQKMATAATTTQTWETAPVSVRPKILVVDNTPENLVVMESLLAYTNAAIVCVESGQEALARMNMDEYAVVLLDVAMPEMNGFQVAKAMRSSARTASTPVIFVTAYPQDELGVREGYNSGAVDFLTKPIDPALLRSKVQVFLNLHRKLQDQQIANHRLTALQDDLIGRQLDVEVTRQTLARKNRELELRCHDLVRRSREQKTIAARTPVLQAILDYLDLMDSCEERSTPEFNQWIESCRKLTRVCMG
jgi:CheY-like chemotaxis protein